MFYLDSDYTQNMTGKHFLPQTSKKVEEIRLNLTLAIKCLRMIKSNKRERDANYKSTFMVMFDFLYRDVISSRMI